MAGTPWANFDTPDAPPAQPQVPQPAQPQVPQPAQAQAQTPVSGPWDKFSDTPQDSTPTPDTAKTSADLPTGGIYTKVLTPLAKPFIAAGENFAAGASGLATTVAGDLLGSYKALTDWVGLSTPMTANYDHPSLGIKKGDQMNTPEQLANGIKQGGTYQPQTQVGQDLQSGIRDLMTPVTAVSQYLGEKTTEVTGSKMLGTDVTDIANAAIPYGAGKIVSGAGTFAKNATVAGLKGSFNELSNDVWRDAKGNNIPAPQIPEGNGLSGAVQTALKDANGNYKYYGNNGKPITSVAYNGTPLTGAMERNIDGTTSSNYSPSQQFSVSKASIPLGLGITRAMGIPLSEAAALAGAVIEGPKLYQGIMDAYQKVKSKAANDTAYGSKPPPGMKKTPDTPIGNTGPLFGSDAAQGDNNE